jgi:hypothetical protein
MKPFSFVVIALLALAAPFYAEARATSAALLPMTAAEMERDVQSRLARCTPMRA